MRRTDPEADREVAVKHLFRHLRDDQQLLRNPLVGPDLLGGETHCAGASRRRAPGCDICVTRYASGRSEQGGSIGLPHEIDLGAQSVASLAGEFEISPRQLARERREAWIRALPHILPKTAHLTSASLHELVHNRALALFRVGRVRDAAELIRAHVAKSAPEAAVFGLCNLALMQHDFRRGHEAQETFTELNARIRLATSTRSHSRLNLALYLLAILLGQAATTHVWNIRVRDLVRRATLEGAPDPWMSRTILRLLFALAQKFVHADDLRSMLAISCAIDDMCAEFNDLDCYEAFALHTVKAISEWKQNGFTVDMEAHTLRVLHLALANGWTGVVAEGASLLASVYYISGDIVLAQRYRDVALSGVALTDDKGVVALTYNNLAIAALESGCIGAAAEFGSRYLSSKSEEHPVLQHLPLTTAEILIGQGHAKRARMKRGKCCRGRIGRATKDSSPPPEGSSPWVCRLRASAARPLPS